ncbi:hypothetical protein RB595_007834 [Gaeumannomyces hyphopodioides]
MPSFLTQQHGSNHAYSRNSGIVHLDLDGSYDGFPRDKVNGPQHTPKESSSHNSNDSFDAASSSSSSNTSTGSSSACPANERLNGAGAVDAAKDRFTAAADTAAKAATMNSATVMINGRAGVEKLGSVQSEILTRKPLSNGISSMTLVDRTVAPQQPNHNYQQHNHQRPRTPPHRLSNGTRENDPSFVPNNHSRDSQPRSSAASTNGESIPPTPHEMQTRHTNKGEFTPLGTSPPSATLTVPSSSLPGFFSTPASPAMSSHLSEPGNRNPNQPHRFSSPPHYQSAGGTPSSSSAALAPPGQGLKHRHTLEVPKAGPSRGSRDGADTAYASGRFSPTGTPVGGRRPSLSLGRRNTRSLHSDMPRDEVIPDDDALRWAEAYRQKRASKRKRLELEDDDRVLVGTKVDESHANWVAAYNMLTGIRVSVSRTNAKLDRPLTDDDFQAKQKSTFDIAGNELVPSAKYDFKFKDYAPWVFRRLRALFGLDPADYLMSLTGKYILSELGSPGKSGSFFYFSRDYKYIIKTIHHAEHRFLRKILKDYYEHAQNNPNTLLSQFYGLHRVKVQYGRKIHFVVMNNLFPPHRDIHQTFDLKGSTVGREYREDNLGTNPRATLKDLNWLRRQKHLELGIQKKQLFLEQLRRDVKLLQKLKIMDYSLLIGIHDLKKGNDENLRHKTLQVFNPGGAADADDQDPGKSVLLRTPSKLENQRKARELRQMIKSERPIPMGEGSSTMPDELEEGTRSDSVFYKEDGGFQATHEDNTPGEEIYYLGVIDCLTHYGIIKKIENFWKGLSSDRTQISALPPEEYGDRFLDFMSGITMSPEEAARDARDCEAREQASAAAIAAAERHDAAGKGKERVSSWNSSIRRKSTSGPSGIPPVPTHQPPPIPQNASPARSPEADAVIRRAEHEAFKNADREHDVPERVIRTVVPAPGGIPTLATTASHIMMVNGLANSAGPSERRESLQAAAVLPVVEETAEASSTGGRSRSRVSIRSGLSTTDSERPVTPAKDAPSLTAMSQQAGFGIMPYSSSRGSNRPPGHPPPTPPKSSHLKPESADSGYGVVGGGASVSTGRARSGSGSASLGKGGISRSSLDKALPPLPGKNDRLHLGEFGEALDRL